MIWKKIWPLAVSLMLLGGMLTGCTEKTGGKTEEMAETTLSENEIDLLVSAGFDRERIEAGTLTSVDQEILKEREAVLSYLGQKYPEETFALTRCRISQGVTDKYDSFFAAAGAVTDTEFEIRVQRTEDGYQLQDGYYNLLIQTAYEDFIKETLAEAGEEVLAIKLDLQELHGEAYTADYSLEEALHGEEEITGIGEVTLEAKGRTEEVWEEALTSLEEVFRNHGIRGSYYIGFRTGEEAYGKWIHVF